MSMLPKPGTFTTVFGIDCSIALISDEAIFAPYADTAWNLVKFTTDTRLLCETSGLMERKLRGLQ